MSTAPQSAAPPRRRGLRQGPWLLLAWAVVLGLGTWVLHTQHHQFPYFYHPDEPGKGEQLITGRWNFNHPMLLLSSTQAAVRMMKVPVESQAVVEVGRTVSALLMAVAVVAFSLTAYLWRGWWAALITGVALALHHQLYELSHYFKEDSALLMGLACAILAATAFSQRPTVWRAAVLGAGCALAISGKYLGVVALAIALPTLWLEGPPERRSKTGVAFGGALLLGLLVINWPLVADLLGATGAGTFKKNFSNDLQLVVKGQGGLTRSVPHFLYWNVLVDNTTPVIWLLLVAFGAAWRWQDPAGKTAERLTVLLPIVLAIGLSFSPKENDRYFLPVSAVLTMLAAIGVTHAPRLVVQWARNFSRPLANRLAGPEKRVWIMGVLAGLLLLLQLTGWWRTKPGLLQYQEAFANDDTAETLAWLQAELPAGTLVGIGPRTGVPVPERKNNQDRMRIVPASIRVTQLKPEKDSVESLRARGVQYVIISETNYGRYFRGDLRTQDASNTSFQTAKAFYESLLRQGTLVLEKDRSTVIYLHPGLRVYRL